MIAKEEYRRRLASVEQVMAKYGVDCLLLNRANTVKHLTGASSVCSWLFVTRDGRQTAVVLEPEYAYYRSQSIVADIQGHRSYYPEALFGRLKAELGLVANSLAAETEHLKANQYAMIARCFGAALNQDVCADRIVEQARMVKAPAELAAMRAAGRLVVVGMRAARENAALGLAESDLRQRVIGAMLAAGADEGAYVYVAAGERSGLVHTPATASAITCGPVVIDIHASLPGLLRRHGTHDITAWR